MSECKHPPGSGHQKDLDKSTRTKKKGHPRSLH